MRAELNLPSPQELEGFGDRQAVVSGAFAHRDVDGLPGGRQHQHCPPWRRCAAARRARIEVVLPAPAGADNGWTSQGERPMFSTARLLIG